MAARTLSTRKLIFLAALLASSLPQGLLRAEPPATTPAEQPRLAQQVLSPDEVLQLPIGVFDSGTGGLTVLEQILKIDAFDNASHSPLETGDGKPDFAAEHFTFLADQANMPYGNYPALGKQRFLEELILKDAEFLLGEQYHDSANPEAPVRSKAPAKALVIACNTATAYGQDDIQAMLDRAGLDVTVIGVIDAGAQGALEVFRDERPGTVGILATAGTVASGAYPAAIRRYADEQGLRCRIKVVQQGSIGLAGAIDGASEFIRPDATSNGPRAEYRGPSLDHPQAKIDLRSLTRYGFDFSNGQMLYEGSRDRPRALQINSIDNYVRYEVVSLVEQLRNRPDAPPLRVVVLGCTHFPFYADAFQRELTRLYDYQEAGDYPYRAFLSEEVRLIDPAWYTARALYEMLTESKRMRPDSPADKLSRSEFYITAACRDANLPLDANGGFTYEYKYSRNPGQTGSDYRIVPLRSHELDPATASRLAQQTPTTWRLLEEYSQRESQKPAGDSKD